MPIYKKVSGVWEEVHTAWRNDSSTWKSDIQKVWVKDGGTWRLVHQNNSVPAGLIIPSRVSSLTGFSSFTAANSRLVVGAGSTYSPGTSGSGTGAFTVNIATNTNHTGSSANFDTANRSAGTSSAGAHAHTIASVTYNPPYQNVYLLKADAAMPEVPINGVVLSTSGLSGMTNTWNNGYMMRPSTNTSTGGTNSITGLSTDSAGSHNHGSSNGDTSAGKGTIYRSQSAGGHTHTSVTLTAVNNIYRYSLGAWYNPSAAFSITAGMIAMYESLTPPTGWYLCNGSNGTPDLRDRFLRLFTTTGAGGNGNPTFTPASLTHSSHHHLESTGSGSASSATYHKDGYVAPAHPTTAYTKTGWLPPYYALAFIQKAP